MSTHLITGNPLCMKYTTFFCCIDYVSGWGLGAASLLRPFQATVRHAGNNVMDVKH